MKRFGAEVENPYEVYAIPIAQAAGIIYAAMKLGQEPDPQHSRVSITPVVPSDMGREAFERMPEYKNYMKQEAEVNAAAKMIARVALLKDDIDKGGMRGLFAKFELGLSNIIDRKYLGNALGSDILEKVRNRHFETKQLQPLREKPDTDWVATIY